MIRRQIENNFLLYLMSKATYLVSNPIDGKATYAVPIETLKDAYMKNGGTSL